MPNANQAIIKSSANQFIPAVCHYNKDTLLTKNGQLIQTFCIQDTHTFGNQITLAHDMRAMLRQSISKHIESDRFAIWFSIVREESDISNNPTYENDFCNDLNQIWTDKNFWNKKYCNKLYVSIVYHHMDLAIKNLTSFVNSFSQNFIQDCHTHYLDQAYEQLNTVVDNICADLAIFGVRKLQIISKDGKYFSEQQNFLEKLLYMTQTDTPLSKTDLSTLFEPLEYSVHRSHIDFQHQGQNKVCSILGIKEYQEMSAKQIDTVLQAPCKFILTEVITFISKKLATDELKYSDYIAQVSKDHQMRKLLDIESMLETEGKNVFAKSHISIFVLENNLLQTKKQIAKISLLLDKIGIVHAKEDIDIEYAFWARLPGNAHLIKRAFPILTKHCASFSSLYNHPIGSRENIWGKAITILNTIYSTPYYFNFHNGTNGHTTIFGYKDDGKTMLLNFLLAMSMQYHPQILFLAHSSKSKIFLDLIGAKIQNHLSLPNPLLFLDENNLLTWLKILCGDKTKALSDSDTLLLKKVVQHLISFPLKERFLANIAKFDFSSEQNFEFIQNRLQNFLQSGVYQDIKFDVVENISHIHAFDLSFFTQENFKANNYPQNDKLLPQYLEDLAKHLDVRSAIIFSLMHLFSLQNPKTPKILALSTLDHLISPQHFEEDMPYFFKQIEQNNGIILSAINLSIHTDLEGSKFWHDFNLEQANKIVMANENVKLRFQSFLDFTDQEMQTLLSLPPKAGYFLIKQYGYTVSAAINLNDHFYMNQILTASPDDLKTYLQFKESSLNKLDKQKNFLNELYAILDQE